VAIFLANGVLRGIVLGYNTGKTPLEAEVTGKGKRSPVSFDFGKQIFVIIRRGIGRHYWAAKDGEYDNISTLGTSALEGRNYVTN
jgi:hypothetical protein